MRPRTVSVLLSPLLAVALTAGLGVTSSAVTATSSTAVATAEPAQPAPRPRPVGRWIVDPSGHALVLHGLNLVYKRAPYAPDATGFGADDARFLRRNGFTTVRLGLIWRAVEPRPGVYDDAYLARVRRTARILAHHGIAPLLDFHQDLFHERFQGEGAPTWAVQDDGLPAQPQAGFPGNYFAMPALNRAFDHFWANDPGPGGVGLQDRYAAAWAHVASYFASTPRILGMDLFNEPWPGSTWQQCANPDGCPAFDSMLQAFVQRTIGAIRSVDRRTPVFYEPNVLFNSGASTHVEPHGRRLAFSFHDYCLAADTGTDGLDPTGPACDTEHDLVWGNVTDHVRATHDAPLLTEFGATTDRATIRGMVARAARNRVGWQFWAYCGCDDPTTTGPGAEQALVLDPAKPPRGGNVDRAKLRGLAVPHPMAVAGTPKAWWFGRRDHAFRLVYRPAKVGRLAGRFRAGSVTTVAVPRIQYRHGYRVHVRGARVVSRPDARVLRLALRPGATRVVVRVRPVATPGSH